MNEKQPEKYLEVSLDVPRPGADPLSDFICTHLAHGMIIADEGDSPKVGVTFYLPNGMSAGYRDKLNEFLINSLGFAKDNLPAIREKWVENVEWVEEYRKSVQPVAIGDDILIRASWDSPCPNIRHEIIMEPRMAFGTGRHETTRSCLRAVRENFVPGSRFLDFGCGSGILSILADQMGATYICAIDYDQMATDNCKENFAINGVSVEYLIHHGSLEKADHEPPFEFVVANILKEPILATLDRLVELTASGGKLVLSGLLLIDETDITAALVRLGQTRFSQIIDNDWLTYVIERG